MTTLEQAARQALEALLKVKDMAWSEDSQEGRELISSLRAALKQQAMQELSDCALNLCDPFGPHEAGCYLSKQQAAQEPEVAK